jgi:hypothetical protein
MAANKFSPLSLVMVLTCMPALMLAHAQSNEDQQELPQQAVETLQDTQAVQAQQQPISSNEILRLEETIRGNKEQPQVLTIVPWQLPSHQRINENKAWQPMIEDLPSIERGQFLRDLAVVNDISSGNGESANNPPPSTEK